MCNNSLELRIFKIVNKYYPDYIDIAQNYLTEILTSNNLKDLENYTDFELAEDFTTFVDYTLEKIGSIEK